MKAAPNSDPSHWLQSPGRHRSFKVSAFIPENFECYARILHPLKFGRGLQHESSWSDFFGYTGLSLTEQAVHVDRVYSGSDSELGLGEENIPKYGSTPHSVLERLIPILRNHTSCAELCWFAVWEGWADLPKDLRHVPRFKLPLREYYLFQGALDDALQSFADDSSPPRRAHQSPSFWWPDDRAWCVAAEVDHFWTIVGGTQRCIDQILADSRLEAATVTPSDNVA
jgi:hypothetical protein